MKKACDWTREVKIYFEHTLEYKGCSYLVIFGEHVNGGFIAVPNWGWSCEAASYYGETFYNADKLMGAGASEEIAMKIAEYINSYLKENNN